ncbi:MAG: class I SAM-dependent methyltransferase [Alphaproteobacteria bacterium]|nr:class I SAM-dependent methyltransferase [Alphaproteobacteria bacterium]MCB9695867.1 class I SAM-dependent methyltransferase [Alphaproteobacteria bacterium]
MGVASSRLFQWIQGAPPYVDVHRAAVEVLPAGDGARWLDVGCGPGLVARLARDHGYDVTGLDRDPAMIEAARSHDEAGGCRFEVGDLASMDGEPVDVVSAASLLIVLPDAADGLRALWSRVRPGGALLIVETTPAMTPEHARAWAREHPSHPALWLWARVRRGRSVLSDALDTAIDAASVERHALLDGMVEARVFRKARSSPASAGHQGAPPR